MRGPHRVGDTEVRWLDGALWVRCLGATLLVDAPSGVDLRLPDERLDHLVLTSGRVSALSGLLGLLSRVDGADEELPVHAVLGDERAFAIAEAWMRHWPHRRPIELDGRRPGSLPLPPFVVTTMELPGAEVVGGAVSPTPVVGVRVRTPDLTVAYAPECRAGTTLARLVGGAGLAVVTAGGAAGWSTRPDEAAAFGGWVVPAGLAEPSP